MTSSLKFLIYIIFLNLILLLTTAPLFSQIFLNESFEGTWSGSPSAPSGWTQTVVEVGNDTLGWGSPIDWAKTTWSTSGWDPPSGGDSVPTGAQHGNSVAWFMDYNSYENRIVRLESPEIDLTVSTIPYVSFYYAYMNGNVSLLLRASSDGGTTWNNISSEIGAHGVSWKHYVYQLPNDYKVSNARIAFEIVGKYEIYDCFLDNVTVREPIPADAAPTNFSASSVSFSGMIINWTDNSTNEVAFRVYRSEDNINYLQVGTDIPSTTSAGTGQTYSQEQFGLSSSTLYYFRIAGVFEAESPYLTGNQATTSAITPLRGIKTIGPSPSDYTTIGDALFAIRTNGIDSSVILELKTSYTSTVETFPLNFINLATTAANTITVRPALGATGRLISGSNAGPTIDLNNGSYVIFDGRPGGIGSAKELTIQNTDTSGQAILLRNGATGNIIRYCILRGVNRSFSEGVVLFGTSNTATGNSNNTITYCDIRGISPSATPLNTIYSSGAPGKANDNNIISNNEIFNFFHEYNGSNGIYLATYSTNWTIHANSFYQTASRSISTGTTTGIIAASQTVGPLTITNNYFGGQAANAGGSALAYSGGGIFRWLSLSTSSTSATSIQGNIFRNMNISTSNVSTLHAAMMIISGSYNIGTTAGNIIGHPDSTNSINLTMTGSGSIFSGIFIGTGIPAIINVQNNIIAGVRIIGSSVAELRGISFQSGTYTPTVNFNISNNTIGSTTVAGSISSTSNQFIIGIGAYAGDTLNVVPSTVSNNTIANLSNTNTGTGSSITGIQIQGTGLPKPFYGKYTVTGNTVRNCTSATTFTGFGVIGINYRASINTPQVCTGNQVFNLSNTATSSATNVAGIRFDGPVTGTNSVLRNSIYNLQSSSTNLGRIWGIFTTGGNAIYANNMIAVGANIGTNVRVFGIEDTSTGVNQWYYNSVLVSGTVSSGSNKTYSFLRSRTATVTLRNNIFMNARTGGTGKHFSIANTNSTPATGWSSSASNYNFLVAPVSARIGEWGSGTDRTFTQWKTSSGGDANSLSDTSANVPASSFFVSTTNLHINTGASYIPVASAGLYIAEVTTDFDNEARNNPPDIGADEFADPVRRLNINALIEGFFNGTTMISDTITVELRSASSPYTKIDEAKIFLNTSGQGTGTFNTAVNGTPYYIVIKHRNSIETWSASGQTFLGSLLNYDFTTAANKAYGDNLKQKGTKWCIYSGDVDQDGWVDGSDMNYIDNDAANFVYGYFPTDLNGDQWIDGSDMNIVDNNSANFIYSVTPLTKMKINSKNAITFENTKN